MMENTDRDTYIHLAHEADQAKCYQDMANAMMKVIEFDQGLSHEESKLFSRANENLVKEKRTFLWMVNNFTQIDSHNKYEEVLNDFREKILNDYFKVCLDVVSLTDKYLIPSVDSSESYIFYQTMKGRYCGFISETVHGDDRVQVNKESMQAYSIAADEAKKLNPTRIELVEDLLKNFRLT